jgi:hypothetical protein
MHHATRNATRKFLQDILIFWCQINKIFVSPNSVPNHPKIIPTQKRYYIIFGSWILGHFGRSRTFSDILEKICYQIPLLCYQSALFCEIYGPAAFSQQNTQLSRKSYATQTHLQVTSKLNNPVFMLLSKNIGEFWRVFC